MTDIHESDRDRIRRTYRELTQLLKDGVGSEDAREDARSVLEEHTEELAYLLGGRGFEEFLEERLAAYAEQTDKAMCSCWRSQCSLKQGEVPAKLRQHGTDLTGRREPSELVVEYLNNHEGGEAVRIARKEWSQMATRVDGELSQAYAELTEPEDHDF